MTLKNIPVVDLFAGPGGLGEGFSSVSGNAFNILVSAEKDPHAHQTLTMRAYFRLLLRNRPDQLSVYTDYCNGTQTQPWNEDTKELWCQAENEARLIELGSELGNAELDGILKTKLNKSEPWVLIGGPPCQAYSLVGRSRNKGKTDYVAENDHRHFLYKEYLRIIKDYRPTVFVMENVKGILSSQINGELIFNSILKDLSDPDSAFGISPPRCGYRIHSLVKNVEFKRGDAPDSIDPRDFIVRSEEYGIPQARHRVILLGVREDITIKKKLLQRLGTLTVADVISGLPPLRSRLSKVLDSTKAWKDMVLESAAYLNSNTSDKLLQKSLGKAIKNIPKYDQTGSLQHPMGKFQGGVSNNSNLNKWFTSNRPTVWLNHEARGHMESDLRRYLFAAAYAEAHSISPKGAEDFNIDGLKPNHKNWESGHFSDRFRVQLSDKPATTVTSHISKDGHYFIHYDPAQCRSLTVREAARIQTFPDNYFFQGNRTQQYHQVGNAVPPYLAWQIGELVHDLLKQSVTSKQSA